MSGGLMSGGRMSGGRLSGGLKSYDQDKNMTTKTRDNARWGDKYTCMPVAQYYKLQSNQFMRMV